MWKLITLRYAEVVALVFNESTKMLIFHPIKQLEKHPNHLRTFKLPAFQEVTSDFGWNATFQLVDPNNHHRQTDFLCMTSCVTQIDGQFCRRMRRMKRRGAEIAKHLPLSLAVQAALGVLALPKEECNMLQPSQAKLS